MSQNYNKLTIKTRNYTNKNTVMIMTFMSQFTPFFKSNQMFYIYMGVCVWLKWASQGFNL